MRSYTTQLVRSAPATWCSDPWRSGALRHPVAQLIVRSLAPAAYASAAVPMDSNDCERLLARDRDELLIELASATPFQASPTDPLARGKELYYTLRESLRDAICRSDDLRRLAAADNRRPEVLAALIDLVASMTHGVPATTVAVLLTKDGLATLCEQAWSR